MHPVEILFESMREVEPYPAGVVRVPDRIPGIAFFPGGAGLWGAEEGKELPPMPIGGVMVVGQDFRSETAFARSLKERSEVPTLPSEGYTIGPTWQNLRAFLKEVSIPYERCFFTNAYMGLRQGDGTTGRYPGSRDASFVERCRKFFLRQLAVQRPGVVLALGTWVPPFLAPLSPELTKWKEVRSFGDVDAVGSVVKEVSFPGSGVSTCSIVALTHPSLRGSNVHRRNYNSLKGRAAEVAMVRDALGNAN